MLSFKITESGVIQVHLDEQGVERLIRGVDSARQHGHAHLCTPSNGGNELDEKTPFDEEGVGEVIIEWEGDKNG